MSKGKPTDFSKIPHWKVTIEDPEGMKIEVKIDKAFVDLAAWPSAGAHMIMNEVTPTLVAHAEERAKKLGMPL